MTKIFSTSIAGDAGDKYQVCGRALASSHLLSKNIFVISTKYIFKTFVLLNFHCLTHSALVLGYFFMWCDVKGLLCVMFSQRILTIPEIVHSKIPKNLHFCFMLFVVR